MVLDVAVTPTVAGHSASAATTLEAKADVSELVTKVPAVPPTLQVLVPLVPGVTLPHAKLPATGRPTARKVPGFVWTTFTVAEVALAVTPKATGQALIASAMLEATLLMIVATVLVLKVPV